MIDLTRYPLWDGWFNVAGPINKFAGWVTIILTIVWWSLTPLQTQGYQFALLPRLTPGLICGLLAGMFYLLVLQKYIAVKNLSATTHIWLWVCFVLSWFEGYGGVLIWIQFIMVGILSDIPFWEAFFL